MSVSLTLQNSINFVRPYIKNQPVSVTVSEPALTAANTVLQIITSPPFKWAFNRRKITFATVANTSDYPTSAPDFGFIETPWLYDPDANKVYEMTGATSIAPSPVVSRPTHVSQQYDDGLGNITFRLRNSPDKVYDFFCDYQRKPPLLYSFASTWDVVSDNFSHIYNLGLLTFLSLLVNDSRFPIFERWFIAHILSSQDGLDDQARDIFLANWMGAMKTMMRSQGAAQAGNAGRGT